MTDKLSRIVTTALAVLLLAPAVLSQQPASQPAQLQQPAPPVRPQQPRPAQPFPQNPAATLEHVKLRFLLGAWEEEVDYAGEPGPGRGRWFARPALGMHIFLDYQGGGPQGPYRANGVLTWDKTAREYRLWWFDDAGEIGEYRGQFTDDSTLALEHRSKVDGRDFRERLVYQRVSPTEVRTQIAQSWDGAAFKPYLDAVAFRTGDRPPAPPPAPPAPPRPPQNPPSPSGTPPAQAPSRPPGE